MKKLLASVGLATLLLINQSFADAKLERNINVSGAVSDIAVYGNKVYVATEMGKIDILDIKIKKKIKSINFPKFKDFMGELQPPKIFSVDVSPNGKKIVAVAQGNRGGREVYIYENGKLIKIIDWKRNIPAYKVRFVDNNRIIMGLSSDEIILYNISKKKQIYRKYIGMSYFSDMEINEKRNKLALTDESGDTRIIDIRTGKVIKKIEELNKDKAFDIDFRNNRIFNGSRDKKAVYYNLNNNSYKIYNSNDFMVFSVGLSPSGKVGAYLYDDKYNVKIIQTETGKSIATLKGHTATPSVIKFINEHSLITGCDNGKIYFWRF